MSCSGEAVTLRKHSEDPQAGFQGTRFHPQQLVARGPRMSCPGVVSLPTHLAPGEAPGTEAAGARRGQMSGHQGGAAPPHPPHTPWDPFLLETSPVPWCFCLKTHCGHDLVKGGRAFPGLESRPASTSRRPCSGRRQTQGGTSHPLRWRKVQSQLSPVRWDIAQPSRPSLPSASSWRQPRPLQLALLTRHAGFSL